MAGKATAVLGFLSALDRAPHGVLGGYLLLNQSGRPLEFHCTVPVKPNRAQEILYGATLRPYLYGELIGQTLFKKATSVPVVLCTDHRDMLALRSFVSVPVVQVFGGDGASSSDGELVSRSDAFELGFNKLAVDPAHASDRQLVADQLGELATSFDLSEPFTRIREAIQEAQQGK